MLSLGGALCLTSWGVECPMDHRREAEKMLSDMHVQPTAIRGMGLQVGRCAASLVVFCLKRHKLSPNPGVTHSRTPCGVCSQAGHGFGVAHCSHTTARAQRSRARRFLLQSRKPSAPLVLQPDRLLPGAHRCRRPLA